jgi:hypothetical protein
LEEEDILEEDRLATEVLEGLDVLVVDWHILVSTTLQFFPMAVPWEKLKGPARDTKVTHMN